MGRARSRQGRHSRIVDVFCRRIVGWAIADHLRTELPLEALGMALGIRQPLSAAAVVGRGKPVGNSIPLIFNGGKASMFHTTFRYESQSDSWQWTMDEELAGQSKPFARVTLTRRN